MPKPVYTVVIDKLIMLLNGTIPQLDNLQQSGNNFQDCKLSDSVVLRKSLMTPHKNFHSCFDVIINNELLGQLNYNSKGRYRYSCDKPILFNVQNVILYADDLASKLKEFLACLHDVVFRNYQQIDIAIDGYDFVSKHEKFVKSKQFRRVANIKNVTRKYDDKNNEDIGCIIGSKESDKHIGIYQKEVEIQDSGKYYIIDFWQNNGLFSIKGRSIDRVEGRLFSKDLKKFNNNFSMLENPDYLVSFFKDRFEKYLDFVTKNKKTKRRIIDWRAFNVVEIVKQKKVKDYSNARTSKKTTLKMLFGFFLHTGDTSTLNTFLQFASYNNLVDFSVKKSNLWFKNFRSNF